MEDKAKVDNLIRLTTRLREEAKYAAGEPFTIEFVATDFDLQFDAGTTESLIDEAAKTAGLEVLQHGKDLALLSKPRDQGRMRRPILR